MSVRLDEIDLSSHDAFVEEVPLWAFRELRERDPVHWQPEPDAQQGLLGDHAVPRHRGDPARHEDVLVGPRGDARGAERRGGRGPGVDDRHGSAEPFAAAAARHEALHAERGRPVRGLRPRAGPARARPRSAQGRVRLRRGDLAGAPDPRPRADHGRPRRGPPDVRRAGRRDDRPGRSRVLARGDRQGGHQRVPPAPLPQPGGGGAHGLRPPARRGATGGPQGRPGHQAHPGGGRRRAAVRRASSTTSSAC